MLVDPRGTKLFLDVRVRFCFVSARIRPDRCSSLFVCTCVLVCACVSYQWLDVNEHSLSTATTLWKAISSPACQQALALLMCTLAYPQCVNSTIPSSPPSVSPPCRSICAPVFDSAVCSTSGLPSDSQLVSAALPSGFTCKNLTVDAPNAACFPLPSQVNVVVPVPSCYPQYNGTILFLTLCALIISVFVLL